MKLLPTLPPRTAGMAFTLVELLVTVSIIAILVSLLLPSLGAARRSAQAMSSAMNLNAMGRSFMIHTDEDTTGRLCTGGFDHIRDGNVRENGWVSDMVDMGVVNPGRALDPSNPARISRTVAEYTGMLTDEFDQVESNYYWTDQADALTNVMSTTEASEAVDEGYNTNYIATWHLVRGDPTNPNLSPYRDAADTAGGTPDDGIGALSNDDLANSSTNIHNIPLLSESRPNTEAQQPVDSAWLGSGETIGQAMKSIGFQKVSLGLTAQVTNGMTAYAGSGEHPGIAGDRGNGSATRASEAWEHEFSSFWPKHFSKRTNQLLPNGEMLINWQVSGHANVLFSDGHVGRVKDLTGINNQPDGFLGAYPSTVRNGNFTDFIAGGEKTLWAHKVNADSKGEN